MTTEIAAMIQPVDPCVVAEVLALAGVERGKPMVVLGLCGSQGSGKSTLARALCEAAQEKGLAAETLSLDDLYLTRGERLRLAATVHPLLATRGVPGTHDLVLGLDLLARLDAGEAARLPRFDKAVDDRAPEAGWPRAGPLDLLVLEGWCLGAVPQDPAALAVPVNALEAEEDADGRWRAFVNARLADYQALFARVDALVLLAAPGFEVVADWRLEQEREGARAMDAAGIARFVAHYERLTRHILAEMPARADLVIELDARRRVRGIRRRS